MRDRKASSTRGSPKTVNNPNNRFRVFPEQEGKKYLFTEFQPPSQAPDRFIAPDRDGSLLETSVRTRETAVT